MEARVHAVDEAGGSVEDVAFGQGVFVAVTPFRLLVSKDGEVWREVPAPARMNAIVHTEAGFLAVGNAGVLMRSRDGLHWETLRLHRGWDLFGVAYGNGTYVFVSGLNELLVSRDLRRFHRFKVAGDDLEIYRGDFGKGRFVFGGSVFQVVTVDVHWGKGR
ncbi:hypothetical protein JCM11602_02970 [Thermus brockianus]